MALPFDESLSPADLPRRMTSHGAVGPQKLARSAQEPMGRFHVEAVRGELELQVFPKLGDGETVQWMQQETPIEGATGERLYLGNLRATDTDIYHALISDDRGAAVPTQSAMVVVIPGLPLVDQSARGHVTPEHGLVAGFVIGKSNGNMANKQYLVRVLGPSLARFGISNGLLKPRVSLTRNGKSFDHLLIDDPDFVQTWSPKVGAFALVEPENEFLRSAALPAGNYSLTVESSDANSGEVLVEIYETSA